MSNRAVSSPQPRVQIRHDGMWPFRWAWSVTLGPTYRRGDALTKERARRKAVEAVRSIREDDVEVQW